jgi:hypothetical protein
VKKRRQKSKKKSEPKKPSWQTESNSESAQTAAPLRRPITAIPAAQISETPKLSPSRIALKWARSFGSFIVGPLLAVVVAIYTFWGPPWPTEPSFDPGFPSFGLPLDVPFSVANKSAIFPISDLTILLRPRVFRRQKSAFNLSAAAPAAWRCWRQSAGR